MARDYAKLIGSLIAHAEDEGNSEEARATYRAKAEELMREYRIAEEETIATDQFSILPGRFEIVLLESDAMHNPLRYQYVQIWEEVAKHAGVRFHVEYLWPAWSKEASEENEDVVTGVVVIGYGYESDVRLAEMLWTSARLVFMTRIDARVNPALSDQENCYFMRNSGMSRIDIAAQLWGEETRVKAGPHAKVQKLYLAECEKRGEEPKVSGRGIQVSLYREAYADSFVDQFGWQLREARDAADATSGPLELPGRKERVAEAFYEEFPNQRPATPEENAERVMAWKLRAEQPCSDCTKTKSKTGKCRFHRPYETTKADRARWERTSRSPEAAAGRAAGAAAAREVNVSRTAGPRTQSTDAAPARPQIG
jgi:hypothetical protein